MCEVLHWRRAILSDLLWSTRIFPNSCSKKRDVALYLCKGVWCLIGSHCATNVDNLSSDFKWPIGPYNLTLTHFWAP